VTQSPIRAVLFDLDGTLLDTAPEFTFCLNQLLVANGYPTQSVTQVRSAVSFGSAGLIEQGFRCVKTDPRFAQFNQQLLALYREHLGTLTVYFPGIVALLTELTLRALPWGIVTNKPTAYAAPLIQQFTALATAGAVIYGDTLSVSKPSPLPLLHACKKLSVTPEHCLYVGDALTDVQASQAAGMPCAVAHYGYIPPDSNPYNWKGDHALSHPLEILSLIG